MMLNRKQRLQITARSGVDDRSIKRFYAGSEVRPSTRNRIEEAAKTLKLTLPVDLIKRSAYMEGLAARIRAEAERIGPLLPDINKHDLLLILDRRIRPLSEQKFFIRRSPEGHYVF